MIWDLSFRFAYLNDLPIVSRTLSYTIFFILPWKYSDKSARMTWNFLPLPGIFVSYATNNSYGSVSAIFSFLNVSLIKRSTKIKLCGRISTGKWSGNQQWEMLLPTSYNSAHIVIVYSGREIRIPALMTVASALNTSQSLYPSHQRDSFI